MSSHNLPEHEQNRPLRPADVVVRLTALWKDGIDFEAGWAALLKGFIPSESYVARVGAEVEMVAEFATPDEAVKFTVHLEDTLGTKASLERTTVN